MRLRNADSSEIDASFDLEVDEGNATFTVIIESAGQSGRAGGSRNPDYVVLLREMLRRCSIMGADLDDAMVVSRHVAHLDEDLRRIRLGGRSFPIALSGQDDFAALALELTRPQADIGSSRKAPGGGNRRKRLSLTFNASVPISRGELIHALNATASQESTPPTNGAAVLRREHVEAAIGQSRSVDGAEIEYHTGQADQDYLLLDQGDAFDATTLMAAARTIAGLETPADWRGNKATVADPLRELGFVVVTSGRPAEAPLGDDPARYMNLAQRLGGTDKAVEQVRRCEQGFLRGSLGLGSTHPDATARCGMCAGVFPLHLLVAAHIKPRRHCSDEERIDMPHVGWALCLFGCDVLFEHGYLCVETGGEVRKLRPAGERVPALRAMVEARDGTTAVGWTVERDGYFRQHRSHHIALAATRTSLA
jgi:hypothetical protein